MSKGVQDKIQQLLDDSSQFNSTDVLVDLDKASVLPLQGILLNEISLPLIECKALIQLARNTEKESGVNPLCLALGIIEWDYKQKTVSTPLILIPCHFEIDKVKSTVKFSILEDLAFLNPFLLGRLKKDFGHLIPEEISTLSELAFELRAKGFDNLLEDKHFLGNFHHHRFEIIKELEELMETNVAPSVAQLLGDESVQISSSLSLTPQILFPSDSDQQQVFDELQHGNLVVQGPPGTGKSQVLSNLISKLVYDQHSAIVVSEKRVALEVIKKKLNEFELGRLCFISTSETISADVLTELKENWNFFETRKNSRTKNLLLSEQYIAQLQMHLDLLNDSTLFGGVDYSTFNKILNGRDLGRVDYRSDLPELAEWLKFQDTLEKVFANRANRLLGRISYPVFRTESFNTLDRSVDKWLRELGLLQEQLELKSWKDLQGAMKKAALCQHFSNETFRRYESILTPDSKEQKRFIKLHKKFIQLKATLASFETEKNNWLSEPSESMTEGLLSQLKDRSFTGQWRFKKQWKKFAKIPVQHAENALHKWRQYLVHKDAFSQLKIEFCDLGVLNAESELEQIHLQLHQYTKLDHELWKTLDISDRNKLASLNAPLNLLYSELRTHFRMEDDIQIVDFLEAIKKDFDQLTQLRGNLNGIDELSLKSIAYYDTTEELELAILKSTQVKFNGRFPVFADFKPSMLLDECHKISSEQTQEAGTFAQLILDRVTDRFEEYHRILRTPSTKLTSSEKELKTILKKGKSILIKEFSKTRSFPSLRELYASEARIWIQLLKPVWLSNPAQVAKCFPMERGLFDLAIFDEASQIPLQNAIGTMQRSNKNLIAGDSQQMGPSSYFKVQSEEITDVLHQASYYWKNVLLKHHYRSEHPGLINFSNHHFYRGELVSYPSVQQEKEAICWHYVDKGIYDERSNIREAKELAAFLEKQLVKKESLGIVAFSQTQLETIYKELSAAAKKTLDERIENDSLFFKSLENVQGEECDILIISLGYGRNPDGEFHMRFGPLNSKNGSKRLNVLLTRAKKRIDLFTSVNGNDFQISSNEAVDLLRQFLLGLESDTVTSNAGFPYGLFPQVHENRLVFHDIHTELKSADELVTLVSVLENRAWQIEFK